jgi:hypothetical protein
MKTKSTIFIGRLVSLCSIMLAFVLVLPIISFSQSPGNPVSISVNHQVNPAATTDGRQVLLLPGRINEMENMKFLRKE